MAARGLGLRAIARELGIDRKTARRFACTATGDQAAAGAISRPTGLARCQPHLHRRWNEGCHDVAMLHAGITAPGYRGSLRTLYRYIQPLRTGPARPPVAVPPRIGEATSWLLRRPEGLSPRQQQLLAGLRAHCAQLDRLAGHVRSFAKMMVNRTGDKDLAGWLELAEADDQPELHTFAAGIRLDLAAGHGRTQPSLQFRGHRRQREPAQSTQTADVRPRQPRLAAQTRHPSPRVARITEIAPEPMLVAENPSGWSQAPVSRWLVNAQIHQFWTSKSLIIRLVFLLSSGW